MKILLALALLLLCSLSPAQENIALGRPVSASGPTWGGQVPAHLTDGNLANQSHPLASSGTLGFYYEIDLGGSKNLASVELVNRSNCCPERLSNYRVELRADDGGTPGPVTWCADIRTDGSNSGNGGRDLVSANLDPDRAMAGRFLRIVNLSNEAYNPQVAEVEVFEAPLPLISSFGTDAGNITAIGEPGLPSRATLSWSVSNADTVSLDQGIGTVPLSGEQSVTPALTTRYLLTATNSSGSISASVTVGVDEPIRLPVLTEFMADNGTTLDDQFGESPDWIEIHNPNPFDLSLAGFHLTDRRDIPTRWTFPDRAQIPAEGYLVVFASGSDLRDPASFLHTNFALSAAGEYLALIDRDGQSVLSEFHFPEQKQDFSYGLESDGITLGYFSPPTPEAANGPSFGGFVEDTKFSLSRGFYDTPQTVAITTATPGATIRYTTDGSTPTADRGNIYTAPIAIETTTVLRAMAYHPELAPTNVDTNTYLFVDDIITSPELDQPITPLLRNSLTEVPSLSIVTPQTINGTAEATASFELIHPEGIRGFQENCGVKHFGGAFTNFDKKNFRLYFRNRYGASKLRYPLFDGFDRGITATDTFDQLNLRSGSHDMVQRGFYMSNRFTDDTMLDMGNINPHGRFMHLYLNGRYWGVYHVRERWQAETLTEYLGGPEERYESINGNWNVGGWADSVAPAYDGDGSAWERIKTLARSSSPQNFEDLQPYLDMEHFIDYMIMWMYGNAEDEYRTVGPADAGSGFKWFLNDADGYLRNSGSRTAFASNTPGVFGRSPGDGPGSLFSLLFKAGNPEYRILLADRIHKHFFNDGAMTPARTIPRLAGRCDEIDLPFHAEAVRWGYRSHSSWTSAKNTALNGLLPSRTDAVINHYRSAGFYPATVAPVFSQHGREVPAGFHLTLSEGSETMYYTTDGSDPRLEGGALNPSARPFEGGGIATTVIPEGSEWSFLDDGSDQGTAWRSLTYDDSDWASGPAILGYGEAAVTTPVSFGANATDKHRTTYFRKTITLTESSDIIEATLQVKRDDGAVVYLNGEEVGRSSMPAGEITYRTFAENARDDGREFHPLEVPTTLFRDGDNVIAVEVHQGTAGSSDLQFDLELTITRPLEGQPPLQMNEHTLVRARSLDGANWSALNEAFFKIADQPAVGPGEVLPVEIHYNPAGPDDTEFIELHNQSGHAVNLRACAFRDGIDFTFPDNRDVPLAPEERVLLVDSQFAIDTTYGLDLPIIGVYRGNLNNGGETLTMVGPDGVTPIFSITYDGADPWPEEADGDGHSLVLADPEQANSPLSWRPSLDRGGSPGGDDATFFTGSPDLDADRDGFTAFAEYARGTSDNDPGDALLPPVLTFASDGRWQFSYVQALGADDVMAVVETSGDLSSWNPLTPDQAMLTYSGFDGPRLRRTFTSNQPMGSEPLFVRVRYRLVR